MNASRSTRQAPKTKVLVLGDVRIDWLIVRDVLRQKEITGPGLSVAPAPAMSLVKQRGGALLLADMYQRVAGDLGRDKVVTYRGFSYQDRHSSLEAEHLDKIQPSEFPHVAVELDRYPRMKGEGSTQEKVFRVKQQIDVRASFIPIVCQPTLELDNVISSDVSVAIVEDINTGFRDQEPSEVLLGCERVVLSSRWPLRKKIGIEDNGLWTGLSSPSRGSSKRLVIVLNVSYLRAAGVQISRSLSWQKTLRELIESFRTKHLTEQLKGSTDVIARLGQEAVLHWRAESQEWQFYYYPARAEDHCKETHPGDMIGSHALFTACVGRALAEGIELGKAIKCGLVLACRLHTYAFGTDPEKVGYPLDAIPSWSADADTGDKEVQCATFDHGMCSSPFFLLTDTGGSEFDPLKIAKNIVRSGPREIERFPRAVFKKVTWVDPLEVETYRHVAALVGEYLKRSEATKPLSIAVFGPPGAGKSFGISTVAETLGDMQKLEFNLSQMDSPHSLVTAFHRARESSITGRIPLVFFDEFDSGLNGHELGWLKYFLSPMQDGKFRDGESEYSLGKCVFVFAGGTSPTFRKFQANSLKDNPAVKAAKARDFLSRLRGHVNVLGPTKAGRSDHLYLIRRALILRGAIEKRSKSLFMGDRLNINERVLEMLLRARYAHGARSIEAVLDMSRLAGKLAFGLADLPPKDQLDLHILGTES
jgi:ATPase family associated with various cellular activities (AAA)